MTNQKLGIAGLLVAFSMLAGVGVSYANPSYFATGTQTSTATTTPVFMTPGTATTTLVYNAYAGGSVATAAATSTATNTSKSDSAVLLVQFAGSSTLSTMNIAFEYSMDGIDWYTNFTVPAGYSTTTATYQLGTAPFSVKFPFASSTVAGGSTYQVRDNRVIAVNVPTNVVRAVITITGANGAVWARFVPTKQRQ